VVGLGEVGVVEKSGCEKKMGVSGDVGMACVSERERAGSWARKNPPGVVTGRAGK
jgi:hypothetical protein